MNYTEVVVKTWPAIQTCVPGRPVYALDTSAKRWVIKGYFWPNDPWRYNEGLDRPFPVFKVEPDPDAPATRLGQGWSWPIRITTVPPEALTTFTFTAEKVKD